MEWLCARQKGSTERCKGLAHRDPCSAQVPTWALQKNTVRAAQKSTFCSMQAMLTAMCEGEHREIARKAQCTRKASSQGAAGAKVCMGSKKQTNSWLKSLPRSQFNTGLHLPLRGLSQKLVGARKKWVKFSGDNFICGSCSYVLQRTSAPRPRSQATGQGEPWFDPAKLHVLICTITLCFTLCIPAGWCHSIAQPVLVKLKKKAHKPTHCKGADTLFPRNMALKGS